MRSAKSFAYRGMPVTIRYGGEFDPFFHVHHMGRRIACVVPNMDGTYAARLSYGIISAPFNVADHAPTVHKAIMAAVITGVQENGEIAGTEGIRAAATAAEKLMDRLCNGGAK